MSLLEQIQHVEWCQPHAASLLGRKDPNRGGRRIWKNIKPCLVKQKPWLWVCSYAPLKCPGLADFGGSRIEKIHKDRSIINEENPGTILKFRRIEKVWYAKDFAYLYTRVVGKSTVQYMPHVLNLLHLWCTLCPDLKFTLVIIA